MRNLLALAFFLTTFTSAFAQEITTDPKLWGSWKGSEKDQQYKGVEKHWVQTRFEDGTYIILFTVIYHETGEVESLAEKGKWWISDGKFFEQHSESEQMEVYDYKFIDDQHVKFSQINKKNKTYEFIDIKILEDSM